VTNILLASILVLLVGLSLVGLIVYRRTVRAIRDVQDQIIGFITPAGAEEPSPLAKTVDAASVMFARAITAQVKATLMGMQSGAVRGASADQVQELSESGGLGSIIAAVGGRSLKRKAYSGLLDAAMSWLASRPSGQGSNTGLGGNGSVPKFRL